MNDPIVVGIFDGLSFEYREWTCSYCGKQYRGIIDGECSVFCYNRVNEMKVINRRLYGSDHCVDLSEHHGKLKELKQSDQWRALTVFSKLWKEINEYKKNRKIMLRLERERWKAEYNKLKENQENEESVARVESSQD